MYAIIEQGGKQYKVSQGDVLNVELVDVDGQAQTMEIDKVLMVADGQDIKVGTPYVEGAKITASFGESAEQATVKGIKLYPMHFRRRKNSRRRIGHRQKYTQITIDSIQV